MSKSKDDIQRMFKLTDAAFKEGLAKEIAVKNKRVFTDPELEKIYLLGATDALNWAFKVTSN